MSLLLQRTANVTSLPAKSFFLDKKGRKIKALSASHPPEADRREISSFIAKQIIDFFLTLKFDISLNLLRPVRHEDGYSFILDVYILKRIFSMSDEPLVGLVSDVKGIRNYM